MLIIKHLFLVLILLLINVLLVYEQIICGLVSIMS
jgi:hypothetical protein